MTSFIFPCNADMWLTATALRHAADIFDRDSERMVEIGNESLTVQFRDQAARARKLADSIEEAAS